MKVLQIIKTAYRATNEEQDDTIVWLTHAMTGAGGDFDVLLKGDAANYSVRNQNAKGLAFGSWQQTQPPHLARDIASLIAKDVDVYVVDEDVEELGLAGVARIDGIRSVNRAELAGLFSSYDQIWQW